MTQDAHVKLNAASGGEIIVNGVNIARSVTSVTINASGGRPPRITVELFPCSLEVDGEIQVRLPETDRAALIALGWTPPADES